MKKVIKKMKGKKVLSLVLAALMLATTFNIALPMLKLGANAATTIDGVTQERVVGTDGSYATTYDNYAAQYLNGASSPTNIVIPGLVEAQDYVIQGVTYYPKRDWMLVTAYHNDGTESSKIFALDAATGEFVAMFSFLNTDGSVNMDHGGGIAVSEHNIYYSCGDKDRKIAYAPISALETAPLGQHTPIQLVDSIDFVEVGSIEYDGKTAYTAYVCYDEGVLWLGNFYDLGAKLLGVTIAAADYNAPSNDQYNSMVFGYRLAGNSSAEEWDHLKGKFKNLFDVTAGSGSSSSNGSTFEWYAYENIGGVGVAGTITAPTAYVGEFIGNFGSFNLTEGVNYTIEFTSTNRSTDMYMFAPNSGGHCNVKQSSQSTITKLEDGRYHYKMNFTAGLKPTGADSTWPTTQSTDGTYTGTYTVRFDQDAIAAGESREFAITDIKVSQANTYANAESVHDEGYVGSPSYALALDNTLKDVQYATVDNGKLYLSRSYGSGAGNSINFGFGDSSKLTVADIDLSQPGTVPVTISTTSTGSKDKTVMAHDVSNYTDFNMMPMSEGLCVIEGNIFISFEGASNKYMNESSGLTSIGNCEKPVDVIWQLDPYELMETTVVEPEESIYYEKVNSLSEIKDGQEYIIVHESQRKDPVTQKNYLYALNADGNFKDYKLTKSTTDVIKGYNGMIGHPISYYSFEEVDGKEILYLENPETDDVEAIRWQLTKTANQRYRFKNAETYFANCNYLYFDQNKISMAPGNVNVLDNMAIQESGDGKGGFWISNAETYFLWCNDGTTDLYNTRINSHYIMSSGSIPICSGLSETPGTFHCDALNLSGNNIIGTPVLTGADTFYEDGLFNIYRRVVDEVASTYESRVYTDLDAKLQEDGTYEVTLETYAISPNHYQYRGEMPTDYIIVADTSSSMAAEGSTGIKEFTGSLGVSSLSVEANTSDDNGTGVSGYGFSNPDEDIYLKHTDGKYYKVYMAVNTTELKKVIGIISSMRQKYYAYYVADDGLYYCIQDHAVNPVGRTYTEWKAWVDSGENESDYSTKTSNSNRRKEDVYQGLHYRFDESNDTYSNEHVRIDTLKTAVTDLIDDIAAQNSENRIALVQYGADANTGYYNTSGTLATSGYTDAFWSVANASGLKEKVSALTTSEQTNNNGIEMICANNIMANSGVNYKADSTRNIAIIFITDGIPGQDGGSSTKAAADAVIGQALTAKSNGAFVYTALLGNNEVSGFNKKNYIDGVSSKYAAAQNMDSLGGMSIDGVNYSLSLASTTINNFLDFGAITTEEVKANSGVGLDNLDANAYLREQLNDAFKFPEDGNYSVKVDLVTGAFDEIGRFSFKDSEAEIAENATDAAKIVCNTDVANKTITVTNYHYAEEYIAKSRQTDGRKLRVTISGLLADETKKIQNTSINNTDTTGIYKTKGNMDNNKAFKKLPTSYFNIPEYTYVLDYGLKMLDTDVNGTLKSVSADLSAQRDKNGNLAYKTESENGLVEITNNNLDLLYHTTPTNFADSGYCLIQRDDGTYDWFEIKVVPASNVYFEEDDLNVKTDDDKFSSKVAWTDAGTATNTQRELDVEGDVVGYNYAYDVAGATYSNGKALTVTVTASQRNSQIQTFDFVGTGVDIVSRCDSNTGMMLVNIKKDGKTVAASIVDTYCEADAFNQTPVFNWSGAHGTYTVEISALYLSTAGALNATKSVKKSNIIDTGLEMNTSASFDVAALQAMLDDAGVEDVSAEDIELVWFDDNSIFNGGTGVAPTKKGSRADGTPVTDLVNYIDGFRVYNPLGTNDEDYTDSEKNVSYANVIDNLATIEDGSANDSLEGIAYITGSLADGESLTFAKYQEVGPKGELYLKTGTNENISFKFKRSENEKVMLGLRAVNGATSANVNGTLIPVNSATEMYYDISDLITGTGEVTVSITNGGSGMLAVNHIKFSGGSTSNGTVIVPRSMARSTGVTETITNKFLPITQEDLLAIELVMNEEPTLAEVKNGVVVPIVDEDVSGGDTNNDTNNDTNTEDNENESFSISSIIEMIIALIEKILKNAFGINTIA